MASHSFARDTLLSYAPERSLIAAHNAQALAFKYQARFGVIRRLNILGVLDNWHLPSPDPNLDYRREKFFDGVSLESRAKSPVTAADPNTGADVEIGEYRMSMLHVLSIQGPNHLKRQFGAAADYIVANEPIRALPYVGGVTYREIGNLVTRFGLREMQVTEIEPEFEKLLQGAYMAYCVLNGKEGMLEPMAVYLPTEEFIHRFTTPTT